MNNLSYIQLQNKLAGLKKKEMDDPSNLVMYFLNPQLSNLGYDIYDFNSCKVDFQNGNIEVKVDEGINLLFSFEGVFPNTVGEDTFKMYVLFDREKLVYDLYFNVLGNWELVEKVDFKIANDESKVDDKIQTESSKFLRLTKYVSKQNIVAGLKNNGEKYFTEAVLDKYLESQNFNNEFIRTALRNEFERPSKELITMLASALGKEFTTMNLDKVQEKLEPLVEVGLYESVETLVVNNPTKGFISPFDNKETDYSYLRESVSAKPTKKEEKEVEKPVVEKPKAKEEVPTPTQQAPVVENKGNAPKENAKVTTPEKPKEEGIEALKNLGFSNNKRPVANPQVNLTENGAVNLDDFLD